MNDQITIVGTVASDPERRRTATGVPVAHFRLASSIRRRDEATGAWIDGHTNWYAVSAYRTLAENALESIRKGNRVIVSGAFKLRSWEANGRQGMSAEIDATSLGHDLLWGTTAYTRTGGSPPERAVSAGGQPAETDPGELRGDAAAAHPPASEADEWASPFTSEETPF